MPFDVQDFASQPWSPSVSFSGASRLTDFGDQVSIDPWLLPIEHLSATQLTMIATCPRQYQQRYIKKVEERSSQARVTGSAFHKAIEYNFLQKIFSHEDLPVEVVLDFYHDYAWPNAVSLAGGEDAVEWDTDRDPKLEAHEMIVAYLREQAPSVQPEETELRFQATVSGVPVPVIGAIDVLTEAIIDLKTSKNKKNVLKGDWRMQARVYQLCKPRDVHFHVITKRNTVVQTPADTPNLCYPYSNIHWVETEVLVRKLAWMANDLYVRFGPDDDWPATGMVHDWKCSYCTYKGGCPVWRT